MQCISSKIPFVKYQGAGNDFILLESRYLDPCVNLSTLAISLCDRRKGVGADGLLLLMPSSVANYRMRIFNADGSEPAMCGNGAYCCVNYINQFLSAFETLLLETNHTILRVRKIGKEIVINLGLVSIVHFPIHLEGEEPCYVVNTGVPHAVLLAHQLTEMNVAEKGSLLRFHPCFAPSGVNVNFIRLTQDNILQMRTYERGVEGETLACGTGAAAVAFVAKELYQLCDPIQVATRTDFHSKEISYKPQLQFIFSAHSQGGVEVEMIGSAQVVFEGRIP